jgi:hypothetical protein
MDSAQVQDEIPSDIDEMFAISEQMQDREAEEQGMQEDDVDEPVYEMTDFFPKKIKPSYEGVYEVKTKSWPFPHKSYFDGKDWRGYFGDTEDLGDIIKIQEWRGLAKKPLTEEEQDAILQSTLKELSEAFIQLED